MTHKPISFDRSLSNQTSESRNGEVQTIHVLLVDDSAFVLEGLKCLLKKASDIRIVGTAGNGQSAIDQVQRLDPDVVLMDIQMPGVDGIDATRILSECCPKCRVLILSSEDNWQGVSDAIQAGAKGYLLKGASETELVDAIRLAYLGKSHIEPQLLLKIRPPQMSPTAPPVLEHSKDHKSRSSFQESASSPAVLLRSRKGTRITALLRPEAREAALSPEQLDQVTQAVNPRMWLPIVTIGLVTIAAGLWSVFGKLPIVVEGQGVLIRPRQVVQLQSSATGRLLNLNVKPGDRIQKGDVLGTIDQSELEQQLKQEQRKLADLLSQTQDTNVLQAETMAQRRQFLTQQRYSFENKLRSAETLTETLHLNNQNAIAQNYQSLAQKKLELQRILPMLEERLISRRELSKAGALSRELVLEAEREYSEEKAKLLDTESQLEQLKLQETEAKQKYFDNNNQINQLKASIEEIDAELAQLRQIEKEESIEKNNQIQAIQRNIAQLELQLSNRTDIVSQHTGRILEVGITPGGQVELGGRIGAVEIDVQNAPIQSLTYFAIRDGKKIKPGMSVQVTPSTVKRERFGGIVGTVIEVSRFPVTTQEIETMIGNSDLAQTLSDSFSERGEGAPVQILAHLQSDAESTSGYQWSSSNGPAMQLSAGTTTQVRVKVEDRTPISYVIPLLREWTGIKP